MGLSRLLYNLFMVKTLFLKFHVLAATFLTLSSPATTLVLSKLKISSTFNLDFSTTTAGEIFYLLLLRTSNWRQCIAR